MKATQNLSIAEWFKDMGRVKEGLYMVVINQTSVPVSNQMCPLCTRGWADPCRFATLQNKVYHRECLEKKLGDKRFAKFLDEGFIITE